MVGWRHATSGYGPTTTTRTTHRYARHDLDEPTREKSPRRDSPAKPPANFLQEPMCFPALVTYCT